MRASPDRIDLVIYHASCPDGSGAAWSVRQRHPQAELIAANYEEGPPDVRGRHVAIVDFSYSRKILEQVIADAASVIVLDHHEQAELELSGIPEADFDMKRSGARMTWDFFHPGVEAPATLYYIEDRDLWRWQLPSSKDVGAYMQLFAPFTPDSIDRFIKTPIETAVLEGNLIRRTMQAYIEATRQFTTSIEFAGYRTCVCNASRWGISDLANALLDDGKHQIGLVWFHDYAADCVRVSMRSASPDIDVGALAKLHGGGGHRQAAGFDVKTLADLWKLLG